MYFTTGKPLQGRTFLHIPHSYFIWYISKVSLLHSLGGTPTPYLVRQVRMTVASRHLDEQLTMARLVSAAMRLLAVPPSHSHLEIGFHPAALGHLGTPCSLPCAEQMINQFQLPPKWHVDDIYPRKRVLEIASEHTKYGLSCSPGPGVGFESFGKQRGRIV